MQKRNKSIPNIKGGFVSASFFRTSLLSSIACASSRLYWASPSRHHGLSTTRGKDPCMAWMRPPQVLFRHPINSQGLTQLAPRPVYHSRQGALHGLDEATSRPVQASDKQPKTYKHICWMGIELTTYIHNFQGNNQLSQLLLCKDYGNQHLHMTATHTWLSSSISYVPPSTVSCT